MFYYAYADRTQVVPSQAHSTAQVLTVLCLSVRKLGFCWSNTGRLEHKYTVYSIRIHYTPYTMETMDVTAEHQQHHNLNIPFFLNYYGISDDPL